MSSAQGKSEKSSSGISAAPAKDVQRVAEIKEYLEEKISELEQEVSKLKDMLSIVDADLREQSFVPAIALQKAGVVSDAPSTTAAMGIQPPVISAKPSEAAGGTEALGVLRNESVQGANARELRRTKDSKLVANAYVAPDRVVIVPAKDVKLSQNTPPFEPFFVNRILRGFQNKDEEDAKAGKLKADQILRYDVQDFEGTISNVTVVNYRENNRLNEILSTATWALTKMLEKK